MLFLSLDPAMDRLSTRQELYRRCHEMGDIAVDGLMKNVPVAASCRSS